MICPSCGKEVPESSIFCAYCGNRLIDTISKPEDFVKNTVIRRIEAVKNHDTKAIKEIVCNKRYSRFDDWGPPFKLWGPEYLKNEANALKIIQGFSYETTAWKVDIFGDSAMAAFVITYRGQIRGLSFNVKSRITAVLIKQNGEWKIVHEHWSRFPESQMPNSKQQPILL